VLPQTSKLESSHKVLLTGYIDRTLRKFESGHVQVAVLAMAVLAERNCAFYKQTMTDNQRAIALQVDGSCLAAVAAAGDHNLHQAKA
jgi:hypothetical protein